MTEHVMNAWEDKFWNLLEHIHIQQIKLVLAHGLSYDGTKNDLNYFIIYFKW